MAVLREENKISKNFDIEEIHKILHNASDNQLKYKNKPLPPVTPDTYWVTRKVQAGYRIQSQP